MVSLRGTLRFNEPLAKYNTWRVGGKAKRLYIPADVNDLSEFLKTLPVDEKIIWIGLGSNVLVRDTGIDGTVIVTQGALNQLAVLDTYTVKIDAGVACGTAARFCARQGLTGIEFLAGVPGTIGGALAMNAGAHGGETWQFVTMCETMDRHGKQHLQKACDYAVSYRHVIGPSEEWFIAAYLKLMPGDKEKSLADIKKLLLHRTATQPIHLPNCGSVFRNPPNNYAAKLIEACGLKGKRIGGAVVSEKHANFIVNDQSASAKDIEALILLISQKVEQQYGIQLIREVHILGE